MASPEKYRKALVIFSLTMCSISDGYIFGQMSVMVAGLLSEDSDVLMSTEEVSWIASVTITTGVIGIMMAAAITERFGRRFTITILTAPIVLHWIVLYYAYTFAVFMIAKTIVGICFGGVISIILISTAEYNNPKARASCLAVVSAFGPSVGNTLARLLSRWFNWRMVALIGIIPSAMSALLPCFWIESPSWLASKGRFEECEVAFRALHGFGNAANTELQLLIAVEKRKRQQIWSRYNIQESATKKLLLAMKQKYFWNLLFMSGVLNAFKTSGATVQNTVFLIPILVEIAGHADTVTMLIIDSSSIIGCCLSSILLRRTNVRTLLFSSGIIKNIIYATLSICTYYNNKDNIYFPWINITLFSSYCLAVNAGCSPLSESLVAELYPLEIKAYSIFIVGIIGGPMMFLSLKIAPAMFVTIGYHGVFMLNAVISSICLVYFWFNLPETKGKTLQEIELCIQNITPETINSILSDEKRSQGDENN